MVEKRTKNVRLSARKVPQTMASDTEDAGELFSQMRSGELTRGGLATSLTGVCQAANLTGGCQDQLGVHDKARETLPRTLSTSVLRIKARPSFWDNFWRERRQRDS